METKFEEVVRVIENRLIAGDFRLKRLPSSRTLADEVGVSRNTACRAIEELLAKGVLIRKSTGRLGLNQDRVGNKVFRIAYVGPAFYAPLIVHGLRAVEKAAEGMAVSIRPVTYAHWDDPVIVDTLRGFDATFLFPDSEPLRTHMADRIATAERPVVSLFTDLSALGIPSICGYSASSAIETVLHYLESLGHRSILCLNTEPNIQPIQDRIDIWQQWMAARGYQGRLVNQPVKPFAHGLPKAYEAMCNMLDSGPMPETCIMTTTMAAADGALRALYEKNIKPGRHFSLCVADSDEFAQYRCPSITCLKMPDLIPDLRKIIQWMLNGSSAWSGPLLTVYKPELFKGESTEM